MFKTLFSRMLMTYLAVTLSLLLLMGITVAGIFRNQYISEAEANLRREAEEINSIIVTKYKYDEKRPVAKEELLTIARKYDALIKIFDLTGGTASFIDPESVEKWAASEDTDLSDIVSSVLSNGKAYISTDVYKKITDTPIMSIVRPVVNESNEIEGVLLFNIDMSNINSSIMKVYLNVVLSSLIAVIMAAITVSYITGRITRPIIEMNNTVREYSAGNLNARITSFGSDEVGQLAKSFNQMAEKLNTLEEARKSFVANVSHELRSPLTSMRGFLEAMKDGTISENDYSKYLDIVIKENNRMTLMVNDLLDLARIESGRESIKFDVFDINELLRRILLTFETRINDKKLNVAFEFVHEHCFVEADQNQIVHVLRNLIDNAIKFSPVSDTLTLKTSYDKKLALISVHNYGTVIRPEDIPFIFDRFYKAEKAHTPSESSGTGLGLSIAKRIIDQHQQSISVSSSAEHGTEFTFTLKRSSEAQMRSRKTQK